MNKKLLFILFIVLFSSLMFNPYSSIMVIFMVNAIVQYNGKPKNNSWARWMVGRVMKKNQNNLIGLIGRTGSGKTYSGISIAEIMSKMSGVPFTIDNVVFSLKELMELLNSGKLKRGSTIIFDEPQVSISSKEFQSESNRVFNFLVSTFRHRNLTLIFCTPFENLLDKSTRKLFHARFETYSINPNNKTCRLKPRFVEYSDFKSEPYRKQLIVMFKDENGNKKHEKLFYWDVHMPSKELIEQYEAKKLAFTDNLNRNIMARLDKYDESGKSMTAQEKPIERKALTKKQEQAMKIVANIKEDDKYKRAGEMLGISITAIHKHVKGSEKKGYKLSEFKDE